MLPTTARLSRKAFIDAEKVEMAQAIFDTVMEQLTDTVAKALQTELEEFETKQMVMVGKSLTKSLTTDLADLRKDYEAKLIEQKAYYESRLADVQEMYAKGTSNLIATLKNLPVSQVIVPDGAIQVNVAAAAPSQVTIPSDAIRVDIHQLPSQVHVSEKAFQLHLEQAPPQVIVPENAIQVNVAQMTPPNVIVPDSAINVNVHQEASNVYLPEKAIQVNVHQAAAPAAKINVNVPKDAIKVETKTLLTTPKRKTKVSKSILYSAASGRPEKIIEETEEE